VRKRFGSSEVGIEYKNSGKNIMSIIGKCPNKLLPLVAALIASVASAQQNAPMATPQVVAPSEAIEEVVVLGRARSASQQLVHERMNDDAVTDLLGAEAISRLGDSTVAAALRRVPGLSLVGGKFVYIRGLGERYSASALNSARIPSPDLTRNVIPLDIFPTSIVESIRVQKSYSPDLPANFGGGSVDIRTTGIPDQFTATFEVGSGFNTAVSGKVNSYAGGDDDKYGTDDGSRALPSAIVDGLQRFRGNVDVQGILAVLQEEGNVTATLADAQLINRQLGTALNRDIAVEQRDPSPDINAKVSLGNNFLFGNDIEFGFIAGTTYGSQWRETTAISRNFIFPEERTDSEHESTRTTSISGNLNLGLRYGDDHEISTTTLYLRNTDDETAVRDFFNENREVSDGIGFRGYRLQFEERDMLVNQIRGTHRIGAETRDRLPEGLAKMLNRLPQESEISWFFSDSRAKTDIPNQVSVSAQSATDPETGDTLSSAVTLDSTAADYRFTNLDDEVLNYGWQLTLPIETSRSIIEISGGWSHDQKAREYRQMQFSLGALDVGDQSILAGPLNNVFSDENILNTSNNFLFDSQGTNNQSYIAATMTNAVFGNVDWTWNDTWRISAGARWEDYQQVALDFNPLAFSVDDPIVTTDPEALRNAAFQDDKVYPAVSVTYMTDWMAETFQLRVGWSETAVRPDLREITDASYIDPITDDLVDGNPGVIPAEVSNFDLRGEWFFENGDNLTITAFYKNIRNPIEFFESAASDTTTAREIINAEAAEVYGVEFEGFKNLSFLGNAFDNLFVQGSLTLQDSELVAGPDADAPTNAVRKLSGASDYVANIAVGFDSHDTKHTASLAYNVFGERLYVAGRNGAPDGFEQPFHSLDVIYSWYPTDAIKLKAKVQNLMDETISIEREGVMTFAEEPGSTFALSLEWVF